MKKILFPVVTFMALSAAAEASALTVGEMVRLVESRSISLRADSLACEAAVLDARADNTLAPLSIEYSPFFRPGAHGVASSELIVSQEFDFPTLYASRDRQARLDGAAALASIGGTRREIMMEARDACLDWILVSRTDSILSMRLENSRQILSTMERRFERREVTQLDVNRVRLEIQDIERELIDNGVQLTAVRGRLEAMAPGLEFPADGLTYDSTDFSTSLDPADFARSHPSVVSAEAEATAARHQVGLAKSAWLPSITLGYRRNTELDEASNGFVVGAAFPIYSIGRKKKAAEARLAAASLQLDAAAIESERLAASTQANIEALRKSASSFDLALTYETITLYRRSLDAGQITLTEYYAGITPLYDRLLLQARVVNDLHRALTPLLLP